MREISDNVFIENDANELLLAIKQGATLLIDAKISQVQIDQHGYHCFIEGFTGKYPIEVNGDFNFIGEVLEELKNFPCEIL